MLPIIMVTASAAALALSVFNGYVFYSIFRQCKSPGAGLLAAIAGLVFATSMVSVMDFGQRCGMQPQLPKDAVAVARLVVAMAGLLVACYQTHLLVWNPKWSWHTKEHKK